MAVKNYYDGLQLVLAEFLERSKWDEIGFSQVAYVVKVMPPSGELSFFTAQCDHTLQHLSRHFKGCGLSSAHLCVERSSSKDHAQDSCLWVRWGASRKAAIPAVSKGDATVRSYMGMVSSWV